MRRFPLGSSIGTGVVFFKITNIEHDVASIDIDESQGTASDGYFAATMGELGCWVDSKVTQIMQTGVEHSRVPDVSDYLNIRAYKFWSYPSLVVQTRFLHINLRSSGVGNPSPPSDHALAAKTGTPFSKLFDLVSAALLPNAVQYDLRLSVLLKGARGVGKQTVTRWIAQKAGIHFMEVTAIPSNNDTGAF